MQRPRRVARLGRPAQNAHSQAPRAAEAARRAAGTIAGVHALGYHAFTVDYSREDTYSY